MFSTSVYCTSTVQTTEKTVTTFVDIFTQEYKIKAIVQYYPLYRYPLIQESWFWIT